MDGVHITEGEGSVESYGCVVALNGERCANARVGMGKAHPQAVLFDLGTSGVYSFHIGHASAGPGSTCFADCHFGTVVNYSVSHFFERKK